MTKNTLRFHITWWFKFLLAILVVVIGGILLYVILPKERSRDAAKFDVKGDFNVSGDFVEGNKVTEKTEEKRIIVTPEKFSMVAGQNRKFMMKVTNNKDVPLYAVQVSFKIQGGDFLTDDINIEPVDKASIYGELGDKDGKVIVSFDGMQMHSLSKRNGEMVSINMFMKIDNISARSTKDYKVDIKGEQRRNNSLLQLKIGHSSKEPDPLVEGKLPPAPEDALYQKGNNLTKQRKYKEAIETYKKAYSVNPKSAKVINNWGIVLHYMGMPDEAIEKYKEAIMVNPSFSPAYLNAGVLYLEKKDFEKAIEKLERKIALDSKHPDSYFLCAKAYEEIKNYNDAISLYTKFIELKPNGSEKWEHLVEKAEKAIENLKTKTSQN